MMDLAVFVIKILAEEALVHTIPQMLSERLVFPSWTNIAPSMLDAILVENMVEIS